MDNFELYNPEVKSPEIKEEKTEAKAPMISIKNLHKAYGKKQVRCATYLAEPYAS